jgi:hypothetical protein
MSNNSIIEHRSNYYYIEFREEYLAICLNCSYKKPVKEDQRCKASPYCKSLILAILEQWTNDKRGKGQDLSIYMTYPQWIDAMYGMFGRTVVIDSLDELIGEGLISRVSFRLHGKDTYKYLINYVEINKRIRVLDERDPNVTRPQVNGSTSKRVSRPQVNGYPSTSGHNIESTNKHYLDSTEEDNCVAIANANAHDASFSDETETSDQHSHPEHEQLTTIDTPKVTNASQPPEIPLQQKEAVKIASQSDESTASFVNENSSIQDEANIHIAQKVQKEEEQVKSKGRQSRKPKAPEDPALKERVERVYKFFDKLAEDITGVKDFHYHPTGVSDKAIKNWLKGNPTEELLRDVFAELWNSPPDPRTGFSWQDHMKIPTILKEYDSRVLAIQARRRKQQQASSIATTASHIAGYTRKPDLDDDDFVYESKAERTQRKRA